MEKNKKCVEYNIIGSSDVRELIQLVNEGISEGWIPQGGIYVVPSSNSNLFQAMIRYE